MTVYRATIPFMIVALTVGIILMEILNPEPDWARAGERLLCFWGGIAVFAVPLLLERWEDQRQARRRHRSHRRRRSRSTDSGADAGAEERAAV